MSRYHWEQNKFYDTLYYPIRYIDSEKPQFYKSPLNRQDIKIKIIKIRGGHQIAMFEYNGGLCDAFIEEHLNVWDFIHASVMIEEAGGYFYPFDLEKSITNGAVGVGINKTLKDKILNIYHSTELL